MEEEDIIYHKFVSIDDLLLIYTSEDDSILEKVVEIDNDELTITLEDDSKFKINDEGFLILKTDPLNIISSASVSKLPANCSIKAYLNLVWFPKKVVGALLSKEPVWNLLTCSIPPVYKYIELFWVR